LFYDIALFLWYYGSDIFRDGDISYWYFVYLSQQIPALEAKEILIHTEGTVFGQGASSPQAKKRLKQLQELVQYGVKNH